MNKLLLILIAGFSLGSYANSYGVTYNSWDIEGTRLDGIGLTLSGAGESIIYDLDVFKLSTSGVSATLNTLSLGYAFGEVSEGSFYAGILSAGSNISGSSRESDVELGWVKRGAEGNQVKVGIVTDVDNTLLAEVQFDNGVEVGLISNDGDTLFRVGYGWKF
jgi:hypothetical protein|tara:strand:- start:187 stop:672 length:486 start_codon:yes stop_codon:yes gene_type:complete